jgi:AhpD family alkylhydroperoxidase
MVAARVASSVVQRHVKYVTPTPAAQATGLVAQVYGQVADEMRLVIPPALLHSPAPEVLAAYWALLREPLVGTGVGRAEKEAVAAAVSVANICPYCADMHTVGLYDLSGEHDAEALSTDRLAEISDPRLREFAEWARSAHLDERPPLPAGLAGDQRAEAIGVAVAFHYLARMVNVFLSSFLLPPNLSPRSRRRLKQGVSRLLRPTLRDPREPGRALALLPPAAPADAPDWAAPHPYVARAVAASYPVFEEAGRRSLAPRVRALVTEHLAGWQGHDTGLSAAWCERLIAGLPDADRAAARLALLTACASYRVDPDVVGEFRKHHGEDRTLIEAAAWASYAAAAVIGQRCAVDSGEPARKN